MEASHKVGGPDLGAIGEEGLNQGAEQAGAQSKVNYAEGVAAPLQGAHRPQGVAAIDPPGLGEVVGHVRFS